MAAVDELLHELARLGGSDLHLAPDARAHVRCDGRLEPAAQIPDPIDGPDLEEMFREICSPEQWQELQHHGDLDLAYALTGVGRFRANVFRQDQGYAAVFRRIPHQVQGLDALGLPEGVEKLAHLERGLVLITGPTGSGKSTTLSSIVDRINATYARHIVTIEDPLEFIYESKKSAVSQVQVGLHAPTFAEAVRGAMRQDADVIVVGELRDPVTASLALAAAEMGILVFATLHTSGVARTIDRVVDLFPAQDQPAVLQSMADTLEGIVAQVLIPAANGRGRLAAAELLLRSPGLGNLVRENKSAQVTTYLQQGRRQGMQTLDDALFKLVKARKILPDDAYRRAQEKPRFEPFVQGLVPSGG